MAATDAKEAAGDVSGGRATVWLSVDPGITHIGWVLYDAERAAVLDMGTTRLLADCKTLGNATFRRALWTWLHDEGDALRRRATAGVVLEEQFAVDFRTCLLCEFVAVLVVHWGGPDFVRVVAPTSVARYYRLPLGHRAAKKRATIALFHLHNEEALLLLPPSALAAVAVTDHIADAWLNVRFLLDTF